MTATLGHAPPEGRGAASPHPERDPIPPVPAGGPRPRWSVMIPTYDCAETLRRTLASVLAQDEGPARMQIEVVDDGSTRDDPRAVTMEVGGGRVAFHAQPRNVGITRNFATCLARARGEIVHLLHGDDWVLPGFYAAMARAFDARPEIGAAFCRHIYVGSDGERRGLGPLEQARSGILEGGAVHLALEQRIMTPSMVVRRAVYERLGGFDRRLRCSEDWEMWVRIAAEYPVWYETEPLACYRMHDDSNTGRHVHTAEDARYNREAIRIFSEYLPREVAGDVARRARRTYALAALGAARTLAARGDAAGAWNQTREALALSRAPSVLADAARTAPRIALAAAASRGGARA